MDSNDVITYMVAATFRSAIDTQKSEIVQWLETNPNGQAILQAFQDQFNAGTTQLTSAYSDASYLGWSAPSNEPLVEQLVTPGEYGSIAQTAAGQYIKGSLQSDTSLAAAAEALYNYAEGIGVTLTKNAQATLNYMAWSFASPYYMDNAIARSC